MSGGVKNAVVLLRLVEDLSRAADRSSGVAAIAGFTESGVRTILVAIPPVTHSTRDRHGFIPTLIKIARDTGVSGYVGEGTNHWPAGHVLDTGRLYRLALDKAPAGAQLHGAAEQGITVRETAETIGRRLDLPAVSIPAEQAAGHSKTFHSSRLTSRCPTRKPGNYWAGSRSTHA